MQIEHLPLVTVTQLCNSIWGKRTRNRYIVSIFWPYRSIHTVFLSMIPNSTPSSTIPVQLSHLLLCILPSTLPDPHSLTFCAAHTPHLSICSLHIQPLPTPSRSPHSDQTVYPPALSSVPPPLQLTPRYRARNITLHLHTSSHHLLLSYPLRLLYMYPRPKSWFLQQM
jgi:hypothetical protein